MSRKVTNGFLILGISGLLFAYYLTVDNLALRIYTPDQQEYLSYNEARRLFQNGPILNFTGGSPAATGLALPALMPGGENRVRATLTARYEEQQGVSVTVYDLEFRGQYRLAGSGSPHAAVEVFFPFPDNLDTLHDVQLLVDGREPAGVGYSTQGISWRTFLGEGEERQLDIIYKAKGANSFSYGIPRDERIPVDVEIVVAGLAGSRVPKASLPATGRTSANGRDTFSWSYSQLIGDRDIQLDLPAHLSFTQRLAQLQDEFRSLARLAPVLVGLFTACLAGLFSLTAISFRLDTCLLSGLGLALFYPLLTFSSGVLGVLPAAIGSLVIAAGLQYLFLASSFGWRRIWKPVSLLLLVFLGFFSIGLLLPWRGLLLSSGGLLLVGVFMWYYARHKPAPGSLASSQPEAAPTAGSEHLPEVEAESNETGRFFCLHCGRALEEGQSFCPGCGNDARTVQRCSGCGYRQHVPQGLDSIHCVHCGEELAAPA